MSQHPHSISRDPVCGRKMNRNKTYRVIRYEGREFLLCCPFCQAEFEKAPELYVGPSGR